MKKISSLLLGFVFTCFLLAGSVNAQTSSKIPYPFGYDTKSAGASSAENVGDYKRSPYFKHPDFYNMKSGGSLLLLEKFKTYQQTTEWSCGNAVAVMVLQHFGNKDFDELSIARIMGTNPLPEDGNMQEGVLYGTTTAGMARFFDEAGYEVQSSLQSPEGTTFKHPDEFKKWVQSHLQNNIPIMVDWLDWSGHWQIIIGYDTMGTDTLYDDVLIFADPYDVGDQLQDGYYIFPMLRFYYMWQDFQYQPEGHKVQQWLIATPKK